MHNWVEIVMRSKNDGPLIGEVLKNAYKQRCPLPVRLVHIDSGSTDNTVEVIKSFKPWKLIQIRAEDYVPGVVLNRGMRETTGDWVVFLNSDAEPADDNWLGALLDPAVATDRTATVFSRQLPRPDCAAVYAHDDDRCVGPERESVHWDHCFSLVSCAVNRAAWTAQPFREDLRYAEDDEWSKRVKHLGWAVTFSPQSQAIHSHNYTLRQAYKRSYGDAFADAASSAQTLGFGTSPFGATAGAVRDAIKDARWCLKQGRLLEWPQAVGVRFAQRFGKGAGYRAGWRHYKRDQPAAAPATL